MSTTARMSEKSRETSERKKVKKKMSKAQIQLAIVKKKQCDAKALAIVEQLLETNVDPQWLLSNLGYISKSHMEDVIEERAIIKLCGYVLCNNTLTIIIKQQYHISTKKNKVYDVSRRKNFCSSRCYGACNYLLEQMLTSPLWLREKNEIPVFRFLPAKEELERSTPGDEIHVGGTDPSDNTANKNLENLEQEEEKLDDIVHQEANCGDINKLFGYSDPEQRQTSEGNQKETCDDDANTMLQHNHFENQVNNGKNAVEVIANSKNTRSKTKKCVTFCENLEQTFQPNLKQQTFSSGSNIELVYTEVKDITESCEPDYLFDEDQDQEEDNVESSKTDDHNTHDNKTEDSQVKANNTSKQTQEKNKHNKCKKDKQEPHTDSEMCAFYTLAMNIERCVKEWFTEDTICLLSGEENTKNRLLENVSQHDKYLQLCKKLNKLQLEDEKDDQTNLMKNNLKPLPHLSVLQEEGKKMELKVRAFFKGKMVISESDSTQKNDDIDEDSAPVIPLTDAHAPNALRRRIFLDKLRKILPDLLRALASNKPELLAQYTSGTEKSALIKALVNTFALSANNITFKTSEWTLVGLIIIKMLSVLDPQMKALLATKQAAMYISMILMSYKLDSHYLDRLVIELTNNPKIFNVNSNENV